MGAFERLFIDYHQFIIGTSVGGDLPIYTVGDGLVHQTGAGSLTVMAGLHTGAIWVRAEVLDGPPKLEMPERWDAVSEATLWCPDGQLSIHGLMGHSTDALRSITVPGPGLLRVQVRARDRISEEMLDLEDDGQTPETMEVLVWPVRQDLGVRTLRDDGAGSGWTPKPEAAAGWAMVRLVREANPDERQVRLARLHHVDEHRADERYDVRRPVPEVWPGLGEVVLPAGDVEVRLDGRGRWRWGTVPGSATAVPDGAISDVTVESDADGRRTLVHRGVPGSHVVPLGLIWEHLLRRPAPPYPWEPIFADLATKAEARAAEARLNRDLVDARRWGGRAPSERMRSLPANARGLATMDRELLDALERATPQRQREVAIWATHRACAVARLDTVDWIAAALAAVERGEPAPPPFDDAPAAWDRLFADPRVPTTVITMPDGTPNCSQQAMALPALFAVADADPLTAAGGGGVLCRDHPRARPSAAARRRAVPARPVSAGRSGPSGPAGDGGVSNHGASGRTFPQPT